MRNMIRPALVAAALLAPGMALAAPILGIPGNENCTDLQYANANAGELYALKLTNVVADRRTDWLWNASRKTADPTVAVASTVLNDDSYAVDEAWALLQGDNDVHFIYVTYPATAPGQPTKIFVDSGVRAGFDFGIAAVQSVGNGLPTGRDAGTGLTIPGTSSTFTADLGPGTKTFPVGAQPSGSATAGSINIAFAPLAEVNTFEPVPGICTVAGTDANPRAGAAGSGVPGAMGGIIGYNVYRIPGSAGTTPSHQDFYNALLTDDDLDGGWVYFLDLRTFNLSAADTVNPGNAPSDNLVTDLTGLQNPDGRIYSGDEVVIFQDNDNRAGVSRLRNTQLAPVPGQSYWYAVQPVVFGAVADFPATLGFTINDTNVGTHQLDLDGDGAFDAVTLNAPSTNPEFISPQAEAENGSQDGLGLTAGGIMALSAPMFFNAASALPAQGQVSLSGSVRGTDVNVQFTTGLERGNVLGYNVYRVSGDQRVRVNEQPILAQGNESNVYSLVDAANRARGARTVDYMVEIVYSDGAASTMVGPFSVSLVQAPARRSR